MHYASLKTISRFVIELNILKAKGLTQENLKAWLSGDPMLLWAENATSSTVPAVPPEPTPEQLRGRLHNRIRSRIADGMQRNWEDYRIFAVLDKAWDQPFYQITPTILGQFIDSDPNSADVQTQLANWGMAHLIVDDVDAKSGKPVKKLNLPVFFRIFVPLVRAYVTIRWAKIMNDRRQTPFFKYEPQKQTMPLRIKCEALTDRINTISNQYGYYDVMKQAVHKMLLYSYCIQFVAKEWDYEEQWRYATKEDVALGKKTSSPTGTNPNETRAVTEGESIKVTAREGLSYHIPHPSRVFWDMAHGKHTLNYGYGCEFGGYWRIMRFRDVKAQNFWSTDAIGLGNADIIANHRGFFNTAYSACTMSYPCQAPPPASTDPAAVSAELGVGVGPMDRERKLANQYYSSSHDDQGVLVTEYFEKLIPKDNGLGEYDCPVWFRFTVAGDGATILYAAPLPYDPMLYYGYDADENRAKNPSLAMEVLPFQDQFGNTLTQIVHTAKQNLANMVLLDEDQLSEKQIARVQNMGSQMFEGLNVFGFSGKRAFRGQSRVVDVLHQFNLPKGNVAELTNVLKTLLDVLERILVMSSQEVAQAASHEQTREEVRVISASMSTRLQFTSTPVDIATSAWKRQVYQAVMAYGDDDMWAHIPSDIALSKEQLEQFGFTYVDYDASMSSKDRFRTVRFNKSATALDMWQFSNTRDDTDRDSDRDAAVAMATIVQQLMNNPITAQAIGADQAIDVANFIGHLAGAFPRDFRLKNAAPQVDEQQRQAQAQEQLKQVLDIVMQQVHKDMQEAITPALDAIKKGQQTDEEINQQLAILMPAVGQLMQMAGATVGPQPAPMQPAMP